MGLFDNFATLPTTLNYKPTTIKTNISAPEFNPDAGRQEAYDQQWKAYIDNLSQSNKKINLNKAKQYFNTQFDQDWHNETGQRQQQFNKIFQPSREQQVQNSANAYNKFTTNLFNSFAKPAQKLKTEGLDFSNVQAVQNWLLANNYNPGKADNMYGIKTKTAIDALLNNANSGLTEGEKQLFRNFQNSTRLVGNKVSPKVTGQGTVVTKIPPQIKKQETAVTEQPGQRLVDIENYIGEGLGEDAYEHDRMERLINEYGDKWAGAAYGISLGPENTQQAVIRWSWAADPSDRIGIDPRISKQLSQKFNGISSRYLESPWRKNGGIINKHQQGGTMNRINYFQQGGATPKQDIQKQIIALVQAAMQGDQKATQTVNQIMEAAKAGDQQAIQLAQMIQAVIQKMKGQATAAKWGSKLGYIRSLKYAKGGKTCPTCQALEKGDKVEKKACGGKKAKKHYFGGWL